MPMNQNHFSFLVAVLGEDGATALQKAADRSDDVGNALVPRAILSWLNIATKYDFEGAVPGIENSHVSFAKSENGFSGSIDFQDETYSFKDASVFHLAASVATAIEVNDDILTSGIRNSEIEKLGKSLDLLAKTKLLSDAMKHNKEMCKVEDCTHKDHDLEKNKDSHGGAAGKGAAASAIAPAMPLPPTAVQPQQPRITSKLPKLPGSAQPMAKSMTVNISKSEAARNCSMCCQPQFKNGDFQGCICLRALAKSVTAVANLDEYGYILKLGEGWGKDEVLTLLEAVGRIK